MRLGTAPLQICPVDWRTLANGDEQAAAAAAVATC